MKRITLICILLGLLTGVSHADLREEAQIQLRITGDYIAEVKPVVFRIGCSRAIGIFQIAENLFELARSRFLQGNYFECINFCKEAQEKAKFSLSLSKVFLRVKRNLWILSAIFERLRENVPEEGVRDDLIKRAFELYHDARKLFAEERYILSLRKTVAALDILKAIYRNERKDPELLKTRLENELKVVKTLYNAKRERLDSNTREQMETMFEVIENYEKEGRYRLALILVEKVRKMLKHADVR